MAYSNALAKLIRPSSHQAYDHDVLTVKRMGNIDKLCFSASCKQAGIQSRSSKKGTKFVCKRDNNLARARTKILEYALCNDWAYFCTLTIDASKFDRYSLNLYQKALSKWINNYNRNSKSVKYLLVPEFHKDGAVHMHGLLSSLPADDLKTNEYGYLDWIPYHNKFGYISLSTIRDKEKTAYYMTKYVSKGLAQTVKECNAHLFFHSKGLNSAEHIYKASNVEYLGDFDYSGEYCGVKCLDNTTEDFHEYLYTENVIYDHS